MAERFAFLLKNAMEKSKLSGYEIERRLKSRGINNVTHRRLSEYVTSISTPPFEKAKAILSVLSVSVEDDVLKESLNANREMIRKEKNLLNSEGEGRSLVLNIKLKRVLPDMNPLETERLLKQRAKHLVGNETEISKYVECLISNDLKDSIEQESSIKKRRSGVLNPTAKTGMATLRANSLSSLLPKTES